MIEIKQRKICGSCKAFLKGCELGYEASPIFRMYHHVNGKPLEPCPKPLTTSLFVECLQNYKK